MVLGSFGLYLKIGNAADILQAGACTFIRDKPDDGIQSRQLCRLLGSSDVRDIRQLLVILFVTIYLRFLAKIY